VVLRESGIDVLVLERKYFSCVREAVVARTGPSKAPGFDVFREASGLSSMKNQS